MQYALKDRQRIEPSPKGRALCPICQTVVIAKCGTRRIHHWAHEGLKNCDFWKENETQWHRDWKSKFPADWREHVQRDESGEKHVADVRTTHGLVLEFQHSPIDPNEREARERFHKNMFWIVDGAHRKRDFPRFQKGFGGFMRTNKQDWFFVPNPEKCLPAAWINCPVSVFFDFLGMVPSDPPNQMRNILWQLLPGRNEGKAVIVAVSRTRFVETILAGPPAPAPPPPTNQTVSQRMPYVRVDQRALNELLRLSSRPRWNPRRHRL